MHRIATISRFVLSAFLLTLPALAQGGGANLKVNGAARIVTASNGLNIIWLTPPTGDVAGSAFTTNLVKFNSQMAFSTFFQFRITHLGGIAPADGFTFVLQAESPTALGGTGEALGYGGITPSVAVEFDTYFNSEDPNNNHVAILTQGLINDLDPQTPYGVSVCDSPVGVFGCMANGDIWSVWISYDGANLNVALADNSTTKPANLISFPIDIPTLLGQTSAYVGFTGGTGGGFENHEVFNWRLNRPAAAR